MESLSINRLLLKIVENKAENAKAKSWRNGPRYSDETCRLGSTVNGLREPNQIIKSDRAELNQAGPGTKIQASLSMACWIY